MTYLKTWLPRLVHVAGLAPLLLLIADFDSVNPIQAITLRTGGVALLLLMFSLAATPLNMLFGWKWAIGLRKPLGLYAFLWMSLHFLTFTVLDYGLSWPLIQQAIVEKRYVLAGFTAFVLVVPLALTSTKGWQKRLGKNWKRPGGAPFSLAIKRSTRGASVWHCAGVFAQLTAATSASAYDPFAAKTRSCAKAG
jgi:methionine sulfoxide reductase heme-binding subunit